MPVSREQNYFPTKNDMLEGIQKNEKPHCEQCGFSFTFGGLFYNATKVSVTHAPSSSGRVESSQPPS